MLVGVLNTARHFALILALARAEASALRPFSYAQVVWAVVLGAMVFGERPDLYMLGGTALVVGGGLYALYRERRLASAAVGSGHTR